MYRRLALLEFLVAESVSSVKKAAPPSSSLKCRTYVQQMGPVSVWQPGKSLTAAIHPCGLHQLAVSWQARSNSRLHCLYPRKILMSAGRHPEKRKRSKEACSVRDISDSPFSPHKVSFLLHTDHIACRVLPCLTVSDTSRWRQGHTRRGWRSTTGPL